MTDLAAWISAGIAAIALLVAYVTYLTQRGKTSLQYVITTVTPVVPSTKAEGLEISFKYRGQELKNPVITTFRVVNTGDKAIRKDDFESNLVFTFTGSSSIVSAEVTASKPLNLGVQLQHEENRLEILPLLINSGDIFEVRVISDGSPKKITSHSRIASLSAVSKGKTPYPPGSGPEGEMLKFDRFMWFAFVPLALLSIPLYQIFFGAASTSARLLMGGVAVAILVIYWAIVWLLVARRRKWRIDS